MTNSPKDLDMSDVIADGDRMRNEMIERETMRLTEHHDPIPLIDVCALLCDSPQFEGNINEFMRSLLCSELIAMSQSNPNGVHEEIRQALTLMFT